MTKNEQLRRRVIELIHGCEWSEAVRKDAGIEVSTYNPETNRFEQSSEPDPIIDVLIANPKPITLARLLKAISNWDEHSIFQNVELRSNKKEVSLYFADGDIQGLHWDMDIHWLLTNPDGSECTLDGQTQETRDALHQLLCKQGE